MPQYPLWRAQPLAESPMCRSRLRRFANTSVADLGEGKGELARNVRALLRLMWHLCPALPDHVCNFVRSLFGLLRRARDHLAKRRVKLGLRIIV